MAKDFKEYIQALPQERQKAIHQEAQKIIAEELSLQALRKARARSQKQVGEKLKVKQAEVSKIERRADLYVSTLRHYIEAVGGELEIIARFPDRPPVRISQFEDLGDDSDNISPDESLSETA